MADKREKLVIIDGHALAFRMFYALPPDRFGTRTGEITNAVYGFTRTVLEILNQDEPPNYLAVSFDTGKTFRDEIFEEYKGTREKMPEDLIRQIDRIHEVLEALSIPILEVERYEADDVLGTIAKQAGEQEVETLIITGDRDLLQLVNEHTLVQLPGKRGENDVYDIEAVQEKYGILPPQIVDYKAMVGDSSDNIPGVAGVGDKSAVALLQEYPTLDEIYENLENISNTRARNALESGKDSAYLSYTLAKIALDAPVEFDKEACRTRDYDREKASAIFQELEFRSFLKMLDDAAAAVTPTMDMPRRDGQQLPLFGSSEAPSSGAPTETHIVTDMDALDKLVKKLEKADAIAFDTETTSVDQMQAVLVGIALAVEADEGYYIPVGHVVGDGPQLELDVVMDKLRPALTNPDIPKVGHNIKYDAVIMARHGLEVRPLSFDTMIGQWLLQPGGSQGQLGLKTQAFFRLGIEMTDISELIGKGKKQITMDMVPVEQAAPYAAADADMTLQIQQQIAGELTEAGLENLFYDIEMPLVPVLCAMEQTGVILDVPVLDKMSVELNGLLGDLNEKIKKIVGYEFNVNSTQQLSQALFDDLGLPTDDVRKTSSGKYSTAADVLELLRERDTTGIIDAILEYREAEKLRGTYVEALPALVNPQTGRIHTSYNQTGAITGRISSSDPNLQNIPIRTEMGRRVRDAFVAAPGHVLIAADYSQVELRILAHMSGDEALKQAFLEDQDIHATTAAAVNGIALDEVTSFQRSFAKAVNFGLLYGMGAFRLARDSDLSRAEAEEFIKNYFDRFPKVRAYLDGTKEQAEEQGYVETLLGRRRYFPALQTDQGGRQAQIARRAAEREAINMPIQGTAADIIKIAMVQLYDALNDSGYAANMILQVHDELILEAPEDEADAVAALMVDVMQTAYPLDVPLKVDSGIGRHWGEVK